jgi:hypothetical protein
MQRGIVVMTEMQLGYVVMDAVVVLIWVSVALWTGYPWSRHASNPPCSGRILRMPRFRNRSAARALVASFGQVQ